jgi:hypothetical protein
MCNYMTEAMRLAALVKAREMSQAVAEAKLWEFIQKHGIAVTRTGVTSILNDPQSIKHPFHSFDHELPGSV